MRTITYNDEAAPWSKSNHVLGTRLLPSSDDCDDSFSLLQNPQAAIMVNQITLVTGTVYLCISFVPCPNSLFT
jgi:hypothetical protein